MNRANCTMRKLAANSKRKFCCRWVDHCHGTKCTKARHVCAYEGSLFQKFTVKFNRHKSCGHSGKGQRKYKCHRTRVCENKNPETCDPNVSKCLVCKTSKPTCVAHGKCKTRVIKVENKLRKKGKGVFQNYRCVTKTSCVHESCKKGKRICRWVGPLVTKSTKTVCSYKKDKKKRRERKHCCKATTTCHGSKCRELKKKVCYSTGPWVSYRKHTICKYVPHKTVTKSKNCQTSTLRKVCCHLSKKCVNDKCVIKSKKCKYHHIIERTKRKKCSWKAVESKKCNTLKQKICTTWEDVCKRKTKFAKRSCKRENLKTQVVRNATIKVTCKKQCSLKFFGESEKRKYCCNKRTVCYGEKCHTFNKNCGWVGKPIKCSRGKTIYRWRTICREQNWKDTQTREQCCKTYQRCSLITNYYRCTVVKKHSCWWIGATRGDVHLLGADGAWRTLNVAGTFKYFSDSEKQVNVYLQFSQVGSGSETSAVTFVADNNVIEARDGKITHGGVEIKEFPVLVGKGKIVKEGETYLLTGYGDERLAFKRQEDGSYTVDVGVKAGKNIKTSGLIFDMKNVKKYAMTKEESSKLFSSYVPYKSIVSKANTSKRHAEKCCYQVKRHSEERFKQCIKDTLASGKCFAATYLQSNEKVAEKLIKK